MRKILIIVAVIFGVAAFFYFDVYQLLTLEAIQARLEQFQTWREQAPVKAIGFYFLAYLIVAALSLPGAAILTLLGGALFGLWTGFLIVSFASSIGATIAFLMARYLLRDTVEQRFSKRLATINEGVERDGAFYLFALRLVPYFPFFVINIVMGLTRIRLLTFYWVSQVGMLAGTFVYVNAGTSLAKIKSLSDIASPGLLLAFTLLGLLPVISKKILDLVKAGRVYKGWRKPKSYDFNMVVIGAGAGGLVTAYIAAATKAKVALIESHKMGGDCLNYGCVPSKAIIKAAKVAHMMNTSEQYGLTANDATVDFKKVMQRVHEVIKLIEPHDSVERYESLGVDVVEGYARLVSPWAVNVRQADGTEKTLTARSIVLATGASPFVPNLPGIEKSGYLTSDTLWSKLQGREQIPQKFVVLGGGPIGCELAQAFARLGSKVTLVEMGNRLLSREDEDVSQIVMDTLVRDGVTVLTEQQAIGFTEASDQKILQLKATGDSAETELVYDEVLCAIGRSARLSGYGLEELGIESDRVLQTNQFLETKYPNIFGVGDLVGPYQLTHAAAHQAWYAAVNGLFGQFKKFKTDYSKLPWCTFVDPEVARVGLNQQEAKAQGIECQVIKYELSELDRAITEGHTQGFVKVLTKAKGDEILGVTIVAAHAGEMIAEFVLAMKKGAGLNAILGTIHAYPTWNEANKYAAGQWKKQNTPTKALALLKRFHSFRRS